MEKKMRAGWHAAGIFILVAALCGMLIHAGHDWGDDFAQYLSQGAALLDGTFDEWLAASRYIVGNSPDEMAVSLYPWGYPLLLAATGRVFGGSLIVYKLLQAVLLGLSAALFYLLCARMFRPGLAVVAGVCFGINFTLTSYVNSILSEPLFLVLVLLFFLLMQRLLDDPARGARYAILMGAAAFFAYLTRSQGICLLLAWLLYQVIAFLILRFGRRKEGRCFRIPAGLYETKRAWVNGAMPYAVFAVLLLISKFALPQNPDSSLYFLQHVTFETLWYNFLYYARLMEGFFPFPAWMAQAAYWLLLGGVLVGLIFRRGKDLAMLLFALGMLGMNIIFPWTQGTRYLLPVWPVFLVYVLYGAEAIFERVPMSKVCLAMLAVVICCLVGYRSVEGGVENLQRGRSYDAGPYCADAQETFRYIREELPPDATVVFFKPRLMWYMTRHRGFRADTDAAAISRGDYFLYTNDYGEFDFADTQESIAAYQAAGGKLLLVPAFCNARYALYRIVTE